MMDINITTLNNGLKIATVERPQVESVALGIWINTGSAYETADNNGISHFIEHMVFKGTAKRDYLAISEDIENVGGSTNAYTSREFTSFYAKMLKNDLELAVDVLADFVMAPTFPDSEMIKEKEVVVQEIKQTYDDPSDAVFEHFQEKAFSSQAVGRSILGTTELVRAFSAEQLREYMKKHYAGENIIVAAAGNLRHEEFVKMIEERMHSLRARTDFIRPEQKYTGGFYVENRDIEQAQVVLGFNGIDYKDEDFRASHVMSLILGGGMSSRLFQEIREKRGLVYTVYSFVSSYTKAGLSGVYAGLDASQINQYLPVVADQIKKITNEYVSDVELQRAKTQIKAGLLMGLESSFPVAEMLARHYLVYGRFFDIDEIVAQIDNIKKEDILRVAQRLFSGAPTYALLGKLSEYPDYTALGNMLK